MVKPKLLVVELWGLGDLVIATPFLQAASRKYDVTLLAKPYAKDLQPRFWPDVRVMPFVAPWTAFQRKYQLLGWPWLEMFRLWRALMAERFDVGISARWDPRDHFLIRMSRTRKMMGFPRLGSKVVMARPLGRPEPLAHRYDHWRVVAQALDVDLPPREKLAMPAPRPEGEVLVHTGAGQAVRVWPLERYRTIIAQLRKEGYRVQVACDPDQHEWWADVGETALATPRSVTQFMELADRSSAFVGNDSGPGHLAAFCGVPTFTIFGPQVPEWFAPLHPASEWIEGKACPYKPCSDYCRFADPVCMTRTTEEEAWLRLKKFLTKIGVKPALTAK